MPNRINVLLEFRSAIEPLLHEKQLTALTYISVTRRNKCGTMVRYLRLVDKREHDRLISFFDGRVIAGHVVKGWRRAGKSRNCFHRSPRIRDWMTTARSVPLSIPMHVPITVAIEDCHEFIEALSRHLTIHERAFFQVSLEPQARYSIMYMDDTEQFGEHFFGKDGFFSNFVYKSSVDG